MVSVQGKEVEGKQPIASVRLLKDPKTGGVLLPLVQEERKIFSRIQEENSKSHRIILTTLGGIRLLFSSGTTLHYLVPMPTRRTEQLGSVLQSCRTVGINGHALNLPTGRDSRKHLWCLLEKVQTTHHIRFLKMFSDQAIAKALSAEYVQEVAAY